jgi:hypothetical protein
MEATTTFGERVDQLDARLREVLPALAHGISLERGAQAATWRYGGAWGTLALHETDSPPRLSLMLYNEAGTDEQDAVEVTIDEDDVIGVLAEPLAGLFTGHVT